MVNILDRSRRIRQVSGQLMPETTILFVIRVRSNKLILTHQKLILMLNTCVYTHMIFYES